MTSFLGHVSIPGLTCSTDNQPVEATAAIPLADPVLEARRVLDAAAGSGVPLRAIGGIAIRLRANGDIPSELAREYADIDLVTTKGRSAPVSGLLAGLGYTAQQRFNALHGSRRMIFVDIPNDRKVDVFVGAFEMCHAVPVTARLEVDSLTIPAAELLLTKLQVIQLNRKDVSDTLALLLIEPVRDDDDDGINAGVLAQLCAADWGLWRTCKQNLGRIAAAADTFGLVPEAVTDVRNRIDSLWARIEAEPKSSRWRLRDRIGDRKRWYEEPEETH
jgi:hypothetical protein